MTYYVSSGTLNSTSSTQLTNPVSPCPRTTNPILVLVLEPQVLVLGPEVLDIITNNNNNNLYWIWQPRRLDYNRH